MKRSDARLERLLATLVIGQFTPPVAVNLMVTTEVAKVRLEQTVGWALLFVAAMAGALVGSGVPLDRPLASASAGLQPGVGPYR